MWVHKQSAKIYYLLQGVPPLHVVTLALGKESGTKFWNLIPLYVTITPSVHQSINPFPFKNTTPSFLPTPPPLNPDTVQAPQPF